jgi:hypothetical protein
VSVLVIKPHWLEMILQGIKTWEIRGSPIKKHVGKYIYLAGSGTSAIYARVKFEACHGPLAKDVWIANVERHCVPGATLPYGVSTYAYQFGELEVATNPIQFERQKGAVKFQDALIPRKVLTSAFGRIGG